MTHKPTGKIYIGSLKHDKRWLKYKTSRPEVTTMLKEKPEEWEREILLKDFASDVTWPDVVNLEQHIIKATSESIGWDAMWNGGYFMGQVKLAAQTTMPADHPWRTNPPWNKGLTGVQSMPADHPWKHKDKAWNKGVKMSNTSNMGGYRAEAFTPESVQKRTDAGQNTRANWTPEQIADNKIKVSLGKIEGWKRKKAALIKSD